MQEESPKANYGLSDLLKASWMRSSIKLGVIATVVALVIIWLMKIFNVAATPMFSNISSFFATYGIIGVFIATIAAGTLLPLGSPTFGFTIGMTINYGLAYKFGRPYIQKRVSAEHLEEITCVWSKWGWTIYTIFGLIPVLPVELLSFICGFLKTSLTIFLALSFLPRFIIFALLVYFGQYVGVWLGAF
jgi:membrane protein YqaA with SNARE-associated domain